MSVRSRKTNRIIFIAIGIMVVAFIGVFVKTSRPAVDGPLEGKTAVVYRSATCGCCANYITYLQKAGVTVDEQLTEDMGAVKEKFGVPKELSSCHTTIIDGYTVEGHIPVEGIQQLLAEKPAIKGIALPNMPSGSPGMPGPKRGPFEVSSFDSNGSSSAYMSI